MLVSHLRKIAINKAWVHYAPRYGVALFFLLNFISIICYPGTTLIDPSSKSYSFIYNFFSDLGRTQTFINSDGLTYNNFFSAVFFNNSLFMCGTIFIFYYLNVISFFKGSNLYTLSKIGSSFGMIGGVCFIGVGLTPSDFVHDAHIVITDWAFRFFTLNAFLFSYLIIKSEKISNKFSIGYLLFAFLLFFYVFVVEIGGMPQKVSMAHLAYKVVWQKVVVLSFIINSFFQSFWDPINNKEDN